MMNCFKNFNAIQINNTSDIVKKADNNAKIDKIENKISDHDIYIYIYILLLCGYYLRNPKFRVKFNRKCLNPDG